MIEYKYRSDITVELLNTMGTDETVVHSARVSTLGKNSVEIPADDFKLINYLMKHRHGTPFEHCIMQFHVRAPIFVWREWHRHRIASYNEESGRYKQLEPEFYLPARNRPMMKVDAWKAGRPKFLHCDNEEVYNELISNLKFSYDLSYKMYECNLDLGIDPGLARDCLPVGIYSSCWVTFNLRACMGFLSLRTHDPDADKVSYPLYEIELAARQVEEQFRINFPHTYKAWNENGRSAP
jgi:thymidylate synthase (FAD)